MRGFTFVWQLCVVSFCINLGQMASLARHAGHDDVISGCIRHLGAIRCYWNFHFPIISVMWERSN